jgi:hypothetical protein
VTIKAWCQSLKFDTSNLEINIQNQKGKAKAYQVKQVLLAIERLEVGYGTEK